jgi:small subunit ribosomal protein S6
MKYYELIYLISPDLSEPEIKNIQEKISSLIQNKEGLLDVSTTPEKTNLSYLIKKGVQAYLASLSFYLKPEKINELEREIKSEKQIIRFLISTKKELKVDKTPKRSIVKKPEKEKKAELKDIEQKLDEILGK